MLTDTTRPIGFRSSQPFMSDPKGIGWRFWIGPLLVARVKCWHRIAICWTWH